MDAPLRNDNLPPGGLLNRIIRFCLENKLVVGLVVLLVVGWGLMVAPFDWDLGGLPRAPVAVDAIPDLGENQQIVFTEWMGRSPQDVEDQITYPLTVSLLGLPGVKTVRSYSFFGFSSIYVIFDEGVDFYWARSRILEKLNSLPAGTLPAEVQPALGPDATALGQVFWYTLEGRDPNGQPAGGWDLDELRSVQDWYVRYALLGAKGVSEVASVGGFVREYQIDVDPDAMRAYGVALEEIVKAVKSSNVDVGARTIEINKVEYVIRGLGFVKHLSDIEKTVIKVNDNVPITVGDIAKVSKGPALRRGALDTSGAEAVGGVVVVRYGFNPLEAIKNVKAKIEEVSPGLPQKTLADGTVSKVTIVPFYDRTGLINETLGTLSTALTEEVLVTIIVVIVMVLHLRSSVLISALLPLAILMCFIAMKLFGVDANIVALSGIAIAIGTMVDMGIVICENILKRLSEADDKANTLDVVYQASAEVGSAVVTAVATTIVSFLPVFTMTGAEGKLFRPLAFTKTFALIASIIVALTIIPPAAHILFTRKIAFGTINRYMLGAILLALAVVGGMVLVWWEWRDHRFDRTLPSGRRALAATGAPCRPVAGQCVGCRCCGIGSHPALAAARTGDGIAPKPYLCRPVDWQLARTVQALSTRLPAYSRLGPGAQNHLPDPSGTGVAPGPDGLAGLCRHVLLRPRVHCVGIASGPPGPMPFPAWAKSSCRLWTKGLSCTCRQRCLMPRSERSSTCLRSRIWRSRRFRRSNRWWASWAGWIRRLIRPRCP